MNCINTKANTFLTLLFLFAASMLTGCTSTGQPGSQNSLIEMLGSTQQPDYRHTAQEPITEDEFVERQYDLLSRSSMDVVVNKEINLCPYYPLLFVRVTSDSTQSPNFIRNTVMEAFQANNFFTVVRTSEPVVYLNTKPYPGTSIHEDDVLWYSEKDPVTLSWLKRFIKEKNYIIADAILKETNSDAGLLRSYSFELRLLDSNEGTVIVSLLKRRASLTTRPDAIISSTIERVNSWFTKIAEMCEGVVEQEEECCYDK